ncbi:protein sprouty [Drosophila busckii]|uniref:protein sprouty n=1 Tax=Drosophila busckii TaxID=30019 RepID=UPI00083E9E06|nr:protein sprouty [Drosophila busckii]
MDRRNGGDPLAPPRPPKLLPRIHRPRAPEPTVLNDHNDNYNNNINNNIAPINIATTNPSATATLNNNIVSIIPSPADFDDYPIHHLTFLPQRPSSLSRNSSNASSSAATANSSSGSSSSYTSRRPPTTLLTASSIGNGNGFQSHFQSPEPAVALLSAGHSPASPVTLAQPRPESERLTNEYVETPLQHATRSQHPAGQQDGGQTTTHHLLLLPQRHQHHRHQAHSDGNTSAIITHTHSRSAHHAHHLNRLATAIVPAGGGTATATATGQGTGTGTGTATGIDGTDGFLHSNLHSTAAHQSHSHSKAPATQQITPPPPAPPRIGFGFAPVAHAQPITQPITKQPASTADSIKEHMHSLEELLQQQQQQHQQLQQQSVTIGGGQVGAPMLVGTDPTQVNPIVCPRCGLCRCEQCQSPRSLPQTWICNKTCLCSAESIIDYASCLCCAKALFYHCARDNDMDYCDDGNSTPCVDNPCSCGPYKRVQRWGWLTALSIVLPCLWCYWPMRGCIKICEKCYGRFAGRGCRCQSTAIGSTSSMMPIVPLGGVTTESRHNIGVAQNGVSQSEPKSLDHSCSVTSHILRKADLTHEKRLLDSNHDY